MKAADVLLPGLNRIVVVVLLLFVLMSIVFQESVTERSSLRQDNGEEEILETYCIIPSIREVSQIVPHDGLESNLFASQLLKEPQHHFR